MFGGLFRNLWEKPENVLAAAEARSYLTRYQATGEIADLNRALELWQEAVAATPSGSPNRPAYLNSLGNGLRERYERTGELADLERVIQAHEEAVAQTPSGSPDRPGRLNNLGIGLRARYARTGELADLERAIRALEEALAAAPSDSPHRPMYLNNLGIGLRARYERTGELADLERVIRAYEGAVAATPSGSPDRPGRLNNLGVGLRARYERTGELADLERVIRAYEEALAAAPSDSPHRLMFLNSLGGGLEERYVRTGELADLEHALEAWEGAVAQTPSGSPHRPARLSNLGLGLRERYARTGELADLERAIRAYEEAVAATPSGSPHRPGYLDSLGAGLRERYVRTGELADLEHALQAWEGAVAQTPSGSPHRPGYLNDLGNGLRERYERTGELADLERAIRALEEALAAAPSDSPKRPMYLDSLGNGLRERYERTGELADLERVIQAHEEAVAATPSGSPMRPMYLNSLGIGLRGHYARAGELADLERVIRAHEEAVAAIPSGSPMRPMYLNNLGTGLQLRYTRTGELADLEHALQAWEHAQSLLQITFVAGPVAYKLGQQRQWAGISTSLVSAYLQQAVAYPAGAPAARRRALQAAEGSKSRLLTELVGRGDLPAPSAITQPATRERELLAELTNLDTVELAAHGRPATPQEEAGRLARLQQRQERWQELERLWVVMAQVGPEAADYVALRRGDSPTWDALARLTADLGPQTALLSLFTTADRTLLFIVRAGWEAPVVVETDLDQNAWADSLRRFFREVHTYDGSGRRGETWDRPLRPLLAQAADHLVGVERIVFAPEALGHLFPWSVVAQRAGWHGPDGHRLPLVTLPALGLLPHLRRRPLHQERSVLVIGNPLGDLKYAEQEAQEVAARLGTTSLIGAQATREAVLTRLTDATVVHLATHASFDSNSPLDSGIVLSDGVLTAREVLGHRLQADLLVLSACQTGLAGTLGGDELAGLAQAFLQAGARSLLVSLWKVNDPVTAALMTAFYDARHAGADKAQALSQAMAHVQAEAKWTHPYYWGAFVAMGDW